MTHLSIRPSSDEIQKLRIELLGSLSECPANQVLGAQLGYKLNALLSPASFKSWIDGGDKSLKSFVTLYLEGVVTPTNQRQGLDFIYQVESKPHEIVQTFSGALWRNFCSVRPTQKITFDSSSQALTLSPLSSSVTDTQQVIPSISDLELREICLGFSARLDSDDAIHHQIKVFADIFEPSLYSAWSSLLKTVPGLFNDWGMFRGEQIKALFLSRLNSIISDETTVMRLANEFSADYDFQRSKNKPGSRSFVQDKSATTAVISAQVKITQERLILNKALDSLDNAQLSRIMVPMDVVLELLAQQKS